MKLGIVTFHRAANYGAVLQTYALSKYLNDNICKTEVVDYRDNRVDNEYKLFPKKASIKRIIKDIIYYPIKYKKNNKFEEFRKLKIKTSEQKYINSNIKDSEKNYNYFIAGSDQVFNYKLTNFDKNYFLDFLKEDNKKISYAASLGMDKIPDDKEKEYKRLLSNFSKISIREEQNKKLIESLTNKEIEVNIDPTFLLSKNNWNDLAQKPKEENYILIFVMQRNKSIFEFAEKLSKETNCQIIYIANDYKRIVKGKYKYNLSPEEWLGYFKYAKYVITNSFHGLAFSIIFEKNFYIELQKEPATANARMNNILQKFKLEDRKVENGNYTKDKIDWTSTREEIEKEKIKTYEYFKFIKEEENE